MTVSLEQVVAHLEQRAAAERERVRARSEHLVGLVPEAARRLRDTYAVRSILLFGSLATGTATAQSDVDLAVTGLAPERYFEALSELMALFAAPVDLVRLEEASESLRDRILAEGIRA